MYRPRMIGLALGGVAIAGVLIYSGAGLAMWGALFASTILWPLSACRMENCMASAGTMMKDANRVVRTLSSRSIDGAPRGYDHATGA